MHCFQTRLKISISQRKLFVFFSCQSTVRVSHRLPLVFFASLNLNIDRLPLAFIARKVLSVKMVSQPQTKDSGSKKLGMVAPQTSLRRR
ncbi:hypothetical protein Prudu_590S000400 [Prunus dulcis]|uniref:Uncharacterized protein n=1 Tax=Prunus dulcis TaxID=3755 RepID=A0A5H2XP77_PRUDU|nr:hypothetical protein Prudu_590S000400 [Prunus dulcis]